MFDISVLDVATASDAGVDMEVIDPRTGTPARDESDGSTVTIKLRSVFSSAAEECSKRITNRRAEEALRLGRAPRIGPEDIEQQNTEMLVACTVSWSKFMVDGEIFAFSPENARKLWTDRRFMILRSQALNFINDPARFMPG